VPKKSILLYQLPHTFKNKLCSSGKFKKFEKIAEDRVRSQNKCMGDLREIFYLLKWKIVFKNPQIK
jgi:hypothetical protein